MDSATFELHGRRVAVHQSGVGSAILLVHGLAGTMSTWRDAQPDLAAVNRVIAPDLPGHGDSELVSGDYSLGAYASWLRDLLDHLDVDRATVVGHSLGGGIALQFAYQFPERCDRLVLVSSGGLGDDVHLVLRAAGLPGSELVLSLIAHRRLVGLGASAGRRARSLGLRWQRGIEESATTYARLADLEARRSFVNIVRSVVDHRGQRINAHGRLHLLAGVPVLIVWGADDHIIPVRHANAAQQAIPGSQLVVFERTGHFPHVSHPHRFARAVNEFMATTTPRRRSAVARRDPHGLDGP